jgi:protein TonB
MRVDPLILDYPIRVRIVAVAVVLGISSTFYVFPRALGEANKTEYIIKSEMETIDIPETEQIELPEPPARPSIPVASDEIFDDEEYDEFESDFDEWDDWDAPPPPDDDGSGEFVAYDKAPTNRVGKTIFDFLVYPKIAMDMQLEGKVYIKFFVDKHGKVKQSSIHMLKGNPVFEEAAVTAVAKSQWKPAMQRDMKVGVWMTVPVNFNLTEK